MDILEQFAPYFRSVNHFDKDNGLQFEIINPGEIIYRLTILEKHLSSPNVAHGATIAGFMDCVLGLSALSLALTQGNLTSTVEFKLNFIRPAHLGDKLIGSGRIDYKGKSLIIASGDVKLETGELVAKGLGTFNTYPLEKKGEMYASLTSKN
ncbi:MAG: PaaI family thioesterase [Bacteriovoracaceae bacterium]|nr:PaaI family thioesterase [Bacteriovoracaceae bacterium]